MPSWLPENNTALASDNELRSLWKIVDLGGGGGAAGGGGEFGTGSPEGAVTASPGTTYVTAAGEFWAKITGAGNTGWIQLIGT